jgi:magnesium transporter
VITCRVHERGRFQPDLALTELSPDPAGSGRDRWTWIDVVEPTETEIGELQKRLGLHPLAVEDVRHRDQRPKVELYEDHAFVVMRPLVFHTDDLVDSEIHAFVARGWIVTIRFDSVFGFETVVDRWKRSEIAGGGTGAALYVLVDEVADGYLEVVEHLEDLADDLEEAVFVETADAGDVLARQEQILRLRRSVVRLRRAAMPLRQSLDLLHDDMRLVDRRLEPYFRDVMEHLLRVVEFADNVRDVLTTVLEVRTAQAANQLNEVMKKLTAWGGIILVPTLIAGIYGMNFRHMPELGWAMGYPFALLLMGLSAVGLYFLFRRNEWL